MPFAATLMNLEIITLNEVSQEKKRQIPCDITYMWNLNYDTNLQNRNRIRDIEDRFVSAKGQGVRGGGLGVWGEQMQTIIYRMDKQQGPTVEHRELYSVSCDEP